MFAQLFKAGFDPNEPRDRSGEWTSGGSSSVKLHDLFDRVSRPDSGFTYQPVTQFEPKSGYAVSIYPERSFAVDEAKFKFTDLARYVHKNWSVFSKKDHFIGAWHDPKSHQVFLDISLVKSVAGEAKKLALDHDQKAYFDLERGKSVTVNSNATSGGVSKGDWNGQKRFQDFRVSPTASVAGGKGYGLGIVKAAIQKLNGERAYAQRTRGGQSYIGVGFSHILKFNPYHAPKGSPKGGQFTSADESGDTNNRLATEYYKKHDDPNLNAEQFLKDLSPDVRALYDKTIADVKAESDKFGDTKTRNTRDNDYTDERKQVHASIINSYFSNYTDYLPALGQKPKLILLGGRGGSGKSKFDSDRNGIPGFGVFGSKTTMVLDQDEIKEKLSKADGFDRIGPRAFLYHEESKDLATLIMDKAKRLGINIVRDGTMDDSVRKMRKWIQSFKSSGYTMEAHYMYLPRKQAASRGLERWYHGGKMNGRLVPMDVLLDMKNNERTFDKIRPRASKWSMWDNGQGTQFSAPDKVGSGERKRKT